MTEYDAVVLAGGAGRRLGGADKPALEVGGRTLLDRVLDACAGAGAVLVVGPPRPTGPAGVRLLREDPPGGGPVAALAAALPYAAAPAVLLLAADLPFLDRATVDRLVAALDGPVPPDGAADGALLVDADGREQPLAAVYRTAALRSAVAALGDPAGAPLRRVTLGLRLVRVPDPAGAAQDCDTWEQVAAARERAAREG